MRMFKSRCFCGLLLALVFCASVNGRDWPMYRADAARSGYSSEALPARLNLKWTRIATAPRPAWPSSARITFDFANQPIVMGDTVIIPSSSDDTVRAISLADGKTRWTFFTGGPIRFAAAGWHDRLFVASDDGYLYALTVADGKLLWKHRGGPNGRLCLGNERMISRWPLRGGPVVVDDIVFYAAGIWPSGGVYVHALQCETGEAVWSNDRTGQLEMPQPHGGANALSGVAPQGYLVADAQRLFVPTGRAVPAAYRRSDGELEYYLLQENGSMGGARAILADQFLINGGCLLETPTGKLAARAGRGVFSATDRGLLRFTGTQLIAYQWTDLETRDRKGKLVHYRGLKGLTQIELAAPTAAVRRAQRVTSELGALKGLLGTQVRFKDADPNVAKQTGLERTLSQSRPDVERLGADVAPFLAASYERTCEVIGAGNEAVCGSTNRVSVVNLGTSQVRWSHDISGSAIGLVAANGNLLVSTTGGTLYCFGDQDVNAATVINTIGSVDVDVADRRSSRDATVQAAQEILSKSGVHAGLCLDIGCGDGSLALELARQSKLDVVGIESDPAAVARARQTIMDAGFHGSRVTILHGTLDGGLFPEYCADLIVSSSQLDDSAKETLDLELLVKLRRPESGVLCVGPTGSLQPRRRDALAGAGVWTHQNSNAANTLCSDDTLLRGPLEVAWYRDGVIEIPDRHAQAPAPLFNRGVLVVEGVHGVCGLDAYNGRTRWVYEIKDLLADWDGVHHDVGVGDVGGNFCLSDDAVFVRTGTRCLKIDLRTGKLLAEFKTPVGADQANRNWGFIAYVNGTLFGTVLNDAHTVSPRYRGIRLRTESVLLFALNPDNGAVKWQYEPTHSLRNNAIAVSEDRLYLIDRPIALADRITEPKRNGKQGPLLKAGDQPSGKLMALNTETGAVEWTNDEDIFGTQIAVSGPHGILLMYYQAVKHSFFKLPSEVGGRLAAFQTRDGARMWDRAAEFKTRPIINGDVIYAEGGAWQLDSGTPVPWTFKRSYGCGQIASSRHLMLFRSATLGYLDMTRDVGTENFGGIRTSCWFNAIPAGGMVLVPDGSSKCACSYQMQAWLGLQPVANGIQ